MFFCCFLLTMKIQSNHWFRLMIEYEEEEEKIVNDIDLFQKRSSRKKHVLSLSFASKQKRSIVIFLFIFFHFLLNKIKNNWIDFPMVSYWFEKNFELLCAFFFFFFFVLLLLLKLKIKQDQFFICDKSILLDFFRRQ